MFQPRHTIWCNIFLGSSTQSVKPDLLLRLRCLPACLSETILYLIHRDKTVKIVTGDAILFAVIATTTFVTDACWYIFVFM